MREWLMREKMENENLRGWFGCPNCHKEYGDEDGLLDHFRKNIECLQVAKGLLQLKGLEYEKIEGI